MRRAVLGIFVGALLVAFAPAAVAHPLGNFTVNRYAGILVAPGRVTVRYVLDLAEIPTFQELQRLGPDGEAPDPSTLQRWADRTAAAIASDAVLRLDGHRIVLRVEAVEAALRPGQEGLMTLRLEATLSAGLSASAGRLTFEDRNEPERLGWREITASGSEGIALVGSTVPDVSASNGLRSYPDDLLSSPLAVTRMEARFRPGGPAAMPQAAAVPGDAPTDGGGGGLAGLLDRRSGILMMLGLVAAIAFGAWHALLPGHGKTLMAAAVVGADARTRQAVAGPVSVAAMHTVSVIALGVAILGLERAFAPETVYPWLRVASGVAAAGIGMHLVRRRGFRRNRHRHTDGGPPHTRRDHVHLHEAPSEGLLSRRGIAALAVAGGILPSPSALIVLLAAIQRGRAAYGLGLVLAFSVGMAVSLLAVSLGAVRACRIVDRSRWGRSVRLVPQASAFAIVAIGTYVAGSGIASL